MRAWIAAAGASCGVLLIGYALMSEGSPEEQIGETLDRLEKALALDGQTTNPLFLKAHFDEAFGEIFTEGVGYRIPELTSASQGRGGLAKLASGSSRYFNTLDVDIQDRSVELNGDRAATVESKAVLTATRGGSPERDERRVRFEFAKVEDGWRIDSVLVSTPYDAVEADEEEAPSE